MMADSGQKLPWIVASRESRNMVEPQILPLVAVKQPDPAKKWQNEKLRGKKDKWNKKRRRKRKKKRRQGKKKRLWEEEAIGFAGNSTALASFPFNLNKRWDEFNPPHFLLSF